MFSLAQARAESAWADSYTRVDVVVSGFMRLVRLARLDAFALLGSEWSTCDNLWMWRGYLRQELRGASREELDAMMEPEELAALALMPESFTVYRGCYPLNRSGMSWSLDRDIAAHFPHLMRYYGPGLHRYSQAPILRTGTVTRSRAVLKLGHKAEEIIAHAVNITGEETLDHPPQSHHHDLGVNAAPTGDNARTPHSVHLSRAPAPAR